MANPLQALKNAYHQTRSSIDKVFKGTKTTYTRKPLPRHNYRPAPSRKPTTREGDSGKW